jgi:hypothetical protein
VPQLIYTPETIGQLAFGSDIKIIQKKWLKKFKNIGIIKIMS